MHSIDLDHNATTRMRPEVAEAVFAAFRDGFANPASQHQPGQRARRALESAREAIAAMLGADLGGRRPDRLLLTSGGTEANNLAVLGIGRARAGAGPGHVIISAIEHSSVIRPAEHLLEQGWRLDTLDVTPDGVVRVERLRQLLTPQTAVVSVMLANHETGVLQPVAELAQVANQFGVPLHTDAVQMAGKLPVRFGELGVAALTVAAHKFHGPLGIGALLVRHGTPLAPILFGGHQQDGLRPGTESVPLTVGMKTALELWLAEHVESARRMERLRIRFEDLLRAGYPGLVIHGAGAPRLPQTTNAAFPGLDGQVFFTALDLAGVACSVGSACTSGSSELSPTLLALGAPRSLVGSSLRFSPGTDTTESDVDTAAERILRIARQLRG